MVNNDDWLSGLKYLQFLRELNDEFQIGEATIAYDFLELNRRHKAAHLFALTAPLITTSDGKKMDKTAGGAVWLNADKISEYDYRQFWRNTSDKDGIRFLKLFTEMMPSEEIFGKNGGGRIRRGHIIHSRPPCHGQNRQWRNRLSLTENGLSDKIDSARSTSTEFT